MGQTRQFTRVVTCKLILNYGMLKRTLIHNQINWEVALARGRFLISLVCVDLEHMKIMGKLGLLRARYA